jgi:CheY-like chemotaxis protein
MGEWDGGEPASGPAEQAGSRAARALLVEDEPDLRLVLGLMLADELGPGVALAVAEDGERALELVATGSLPDVVLIGLDLPGRSGAEVVRHIRARGGLGLIVVFSALAMVDADGVQAALDAGADVVVPKPDVARLREVLRRAPVLSGRRLQ